MSMVDSGDVSDHPYQNQFEVFFENLAKGRAMPGTSLDEAVKSHELIFASDLSAERGEPVRIAEVRKGKTK